MNVNICNILNVEVSFQENTWTEITKNISIQQVLNIIKKEEYKNVIGKLRNELEKGNIEYYNSNKKRLPAVTFSGTFKKKRTLDYIQSYNPIVVIDIDKLDNEELDRVYDVLAKEPYVLSFWKSPSNKGFKGIVPLNYNTDSQDSNLIHKSAFEKLSEYFKKEHNIELDKSGSDITRLCFISSDKELVLKEEVTFFKVEDEDLLDNKSSKTDEKIKHYVLRSSNKKDALYNPKNRNKSKDRTAMSNIIKYLTIKNKSITYSYADWYKVAMGIANSFTFDIGKKYFNKLSALDVGKYNSINCENFLTDCYEMRNGSIKFASIIYLANQQGYKTKSQKSKGGSEDGGQKQLS